MKVRDLCVKLEIYKPDFDDLPSKIVRSSYEKHTMKVRDTYMLMYNTSQFVLWSLTLYSLLASLAQSGDLCSAYSAAERWARVGQALSAAEVLHAALGLAGGGVVAAFVQAAGRGAVLFAVLPYVRSAPCGMSSALVGAWAAGDIVRYAFYVDTLLQGGQRWLLWLRYSLFLALYPVGMTAEWLIYYTTLAEIDTIALHAVRMPNAWNFAFDFGVWNRIVLASYAYFAPYMFSYMLRQRRRKLAVPDAAS